MDENKTYHHMDLKNDLIEKGIELVNCDGLRSFTLRKAAAACGVSHSAPYSHFKNKNDLLNAMQCHITDEFSQTLQSAIALYGDKPDVLGYLGKAYVIFFVENPHYFSFLYTQSNMQIDLTFTKDGEQNYAPFEVFKELALSLMRANDYPEERHKDAVIALWSFIHGITSLATMKNVNYDEDWEAKISDFMMVFNCPFLANNQASQQEEES